MAAVNKAIVLGNLGADPEARFLASGEAVTNVRIATTEKWKDKNGQAQERTEWHSVSFFGKLAEIAGQYLKKGSPVYVEGSLRTRKWQDKDGNDRYTTEIIAREMQLLGGKAPEEQERPAQKAKPQRQPGADEGEDDLPF